MVTFVEVSRFIQTASVPEVLDIQEQCLRQRKREPISRCNGEKLQQILAFIESSAVGEVLDIQSQCLQRMDVLFGFAEDGRKRFRSEPGIVSRSVRGRGEPLCFLKLLGEAIGQALAMLFLKEAVSMRACNSEMCSWWQPATRFMRGFMQCSPVGCLLRPYLAAHGSQSVLAAIQELCGWARGSILPYDTLVPASKFSNGFTLEEAQKLHDHQVSMTAGTRAVSLSSSWCSVMAQQLLQGAVFARSDPVRISIQSFAESIPSVLEWTVCDFETGLSKLEVDGGFGSGYNEDEEFKERMATVDGSVEVKLEISYFRFADEDQGDAESKLSCTGAVHGQSMRFFCYYNSFDSGQQEVSGDVIALTVLGRALLGREADMATMLHVLWRLLCAPMMVWPRWTPERSCKFSNIAAAIEPDEEPACAPGLFRARNLFEIVASHISVQEDAVALRGVRELGYVSVSKSPFDEETGLDQISSSCLL